MGLSSIIDRVLPAAVGFATGGPVGAFTATVATEQAKTQEKKIKQQNLQFLQNRREINMNYPSGFDPVTGNITSSGSSTQNAGFGP